MYILRRILYEKSINHLLYLNTKSKKVTNNEKNITNHSNVFAN